MSFKAKYKVRMNVIVKFKVRIKVMILVRVTVNDGYPVSESVLGPGS